MKWLRLAAVARAAKQMVLEVRRERLLEVIRELEESRRVVGRMKEAHEHKRRVRKAREGG